MAATPYSDYGNGMISEEEKKKKKDAYKDALKRRLRRGSY